MTRRRAWALRGERAVDAAPEGHWQVTTLLGAMKADGIAAAMTVDAPTDGQIFRIFVDRILSPTLGKGDVVVMDNLSAHKVAGIAEAITKTGAKLCYLPPYSPDFSPIEPCWSKVKEYLRSARARTCDALDRSISKALAGVGADDARGWFAH